jgi:hypothetical protein
VSVLGAAVCVTVLATAASGPAPTAPAEGEPGGNVIAVIAPAGADAAVNEALSRFKGEASAVGFAVVVLPGMASPAATAAAMAAQMEVAARAASAVATVAFVVGGDSRALDVWFTDRHTGKTVLGHIAVERETGGRASGVLAVKAVDFLRARLIDFLATRPALPGPATVAPPSGPALLRSPSRSPPPSPPPPSPPPPSPSPSSSSSRADASGHPAARFGLALGVGLLHSLQGLGTTIVPVLRAAFVLGGRSALRVTLVGLGTRTTARRVMGGAASVRQDLATLDWVVTLGERWLRPRLTVGAGIFLVTGEGVAAAPYVGRGAEGVSFAAAASAGTCVALGGRWWLTAEAGAFWLVPEAQVTIAGLDGGRTGRPGLSLTAAMEALF